jgi:predicted PhzF superfamily epimerase YddE/YHI9
MITLCGADIALVGSTGKPMKMWQIDAFTDRPFRGNPAAVCLLDEHRDVGWMQSVATEMNLSETAFVHRDPEGFELRWFTPTTEVDLCGHATLAAAQALWEDGVTDPELRFHTRSGRLTARREEDLIWLDFPTVPAVQVTEAKAAEVAAALGGTPHWVGRSRFDHIAAFADENQVRQLRPDLAEVAALDGCGVIVTAPGGGEADFVSRYFVPSEGIDEDPVTGSAHCCLGPYWASHLGRTELLGYQASQRGGHVHVRLSGDRVLLGGNAVTVLRGRLADSV